MHLEEFFYLVVPRFILICDEIVVEALVDRVLAAREVRVEVFGSALHSNKPLTRKALRMGEREDNVTIGIAEIVGDAQRLQPIAALVSIRAHQPLAAAWASAIPKV